VILTSGFSIVHFNFIIYLHHSPITIGFYFFIVVYPIGSINIRTQAFRHIFFIGIILLYLLYSLLRRMMNQHRRMMPCHFKVKAFFNGRHPYLTSNVGSSLLFNICFHHVYTHRVLINNRNTKVSILSGTTSQVMSGFRSATQNQKRTIQSNKRFEHELVGYVRCRSIEYFLLFIFVFTVSIDRRPFLVL
jgi:hypothetical protein